MLEGGAATTALHVPMALWGGQSRLFTSPAPAQLFQKLLAMSYKLVNVIYYQVLSQKPTYQ